MVNKNGLLSVFFMSENKFINSKTKHDFFDNLLKQKT